MGFFDVFKGKQYKKELEELKKSKMSIEQMDAFELQQSIIDKKKELDELNSNVEKLSTEKKTLADKLNELSQKIDNANSTIEMQEYGLYEPKL